MTRKIPSRQRIAAMNLESAALADALQAPPFPVVQQYGTYSFKTPTGYPTAVTIKGVGRVRARSFKSWVGKQLPGAADTEDFRLLEPSPELMVAMLIKQEKSKCQKN